jgi:hypothetical protein
MSEDSTPLRDPTASKNPTQTSQHNIITVVRDPNGPLGKRFELNSDDSISKTSNVMLSFGVATQHRVSTATELKKLLEGVGKDPNAAIMNSFFPDIPIGEPFVILSGKEIEKRLGIPADNRDEQKGVHKIEVDGKPLKAVGRFKENMRPSSWVLIDRDVDQKTPERFANLDQNEFVTSLDKLIPGIRSTTLVITQSSSARVTRNGSSVSSGNGHMFFKIDDSGDIDRVRAIILAKAIEEKLAWLKPRYSKAEPKKVVAQSWATIIDPSVWNPGRLIFCGQPTVAEGLEVLSPTIQIRPGMGKAVDTSLIAMPAVDRVRKLSREAGSELSVSVNNGVVSNSANDLKLETELDTKDFGTVTVLDLLKRNETGNVRCQSPFRDSTSWAAFYSTNDQGIPYVYDNATNITHWLNPFQQDEIKANKVSAGVRRLKGEVKGDSAAVLEPDAIEATSNIVTISKTVLVPLTKKPDAVTNISVKDSPSAADKRGKSVILAVDKPPLDVGQSRALVDAASKLDVTEFPNPPTGSSSNPEVTLANIRHLFDKYNISARYNLIKKKPEFGICNLSLLPDNIDNSTLDYIKSLANLNGMKSSDVLRFAETVCSANPFNPVAEWIWSKPWDGADRLPEIYATLQVDPDFPDKLKQALIMRWLLSAVAAVSMPVGFRARGLLTLQGKQGLGKTQWFASLAKQLRTDDKYVLLGQHLDISNKDDVLTSIRHWIVELGELDSTFRKDIAALKAFITKDCDQVRKPYDRTDSIFPRRTVYGGSVNSSYFLVDPTGNSRFWTLPVIGIDYDHDVDMQQLFAQLHVEFLGGEQWWLTPEEEVLLDEQNQSHIATSPIQELVRSNIDLVRIGEDGLPAYGARELLVELGIKEPNNAQSRECGEVLREQTGKPKRIQGYDKWRVPLIEGAKFSGL